MLSRPHLALALASFVAAMGAATFLVFSLGLGVRTVLMANLGAGTVLLAVTALACLRGSVQINRRLRRAWPTAAMLLVPVAFTGWAVEQAHPFASWPELLAVLQCALPFTVLLALQSAVAIPAVTPPASESLSYGKRSARGFTYFALALAFLVVGIALAMRFALLPLEHVLDVDAAIVLSIFAAAYALNSVHCALAPTLNLSARPALATQLGALAAVLNLLLNLALVPAWGVLGAAISTLLTFLALAAATFWAAQRHLPLPYEYGRLLKIGCTATIVLLAALRWPPSDDWTTIASYAAAAVIGFVVVLGLSGFLLRSERVALRRLVAFSNG